MVAVSSNHCSADACVHEDEQPVLRGGDPQKFKLWRNPTSDQQTKAAVHAANLQTLENPTLADGHDQLDQS